MTATTIRVQMAQRKDTAANWTSANPILLSGEIGYETDTKKFKIGNGSTNWNSLAYLPIPDGSGNLTITGNLEIGSTGSLTFEGSTADGFETTLAVTNPTADRTITLPDRSGTVITSGDTGTVTSTMLVDGTIVNEDVNAAAAIAGTKISPDFGSQTVQTTGIFSHALGSASAPTVTFTGDTNTGLYSPGADQVAISTNGTKRIEIQADGDIDIDNGGVFYDATNNRLAIGTTSASESLTVGSGNVQVTNGQLALGVFGTSGLQLINDGTIGTVNSLPLIFRTGAAERGRFDTSGRLLVGTSSARSNIDGSNTPQVQFEGVGYPGATFSLTRNSADSGGPVFYFAKTRSGSVGGIAAAQSGDTLGSFVWTGSDGTGTIKAAAIESFVDGTPGTNDMPGRLTFSTTADGASSPTERMRIKSNGHVLLNTDSDLAHFAVVDSTYVASDIFIRTYGNGGASFIVRGDGDVENTNNSYGAISDIKLKENIVDANSQWADIKSLQVRNYNLKEGQTHTQIGLIAQEVELVSPGLVSESPDRDEDGNDLGTVTKSVNYSVLYMKAVKALQEAMERIEQLETSNADLLARVTALESA